MVLVLCSCVAALSGQARGAGAQPAAMVEHAVLVRGPPPWSGVLSLFVARRHGLVCCADVSQAYLVAHDVLLRGPRPLSGVPCWRVVSLLRLACPLPWLQSMFCCVTGLLVRACYVGAWPAPRIGRAALVRHLPPW